ncbi:hypothetical protein [Candidatus Tisiphia endosymbiont of Hybos culiciformis]|uniref:hypothetical protein n=1 Tax=Candidatus Tisiphia endosymbiont of Hybos culiciformis TaxID=3139331 RepID=UPI003CCB69CB
MATPHHSKISYSNKHFSSQIIYTIIVMLIGLGDKEHNDCKLSFPRRRESR